MFELILIVVLSISVLLLVIKNLKLHRKIVDYEIQVFMKNIDDELVSSTREDLSIIERILQ